MLCALSGKEYFVRQNCGQRCGAGSFESGYTEWLLRADKIMRRRTGTNFAALGCDYFLLAIHRISAISILSDAVPRLQQQDMMRLRRHTHLYLPLLSEREGKKCRLHISRMRVPKVSFYSSSDHANISEMKRQCKENFNVRYVTRVQSKDDIRERLYYNHIIQYNE
jgi:hypothetical protein